MMHAELFQVAYTGVTFAYFVGLLTAQKPFAYTFSLNARSNHSYKFGCSWLRREQFENCLHSLGNLKTKKLLYKTFCFGF